MNRRKIYTSLVIIFLALAAAIPVNRAALTKETTHVVPGQVIVGLWKISAASVQGITAIGGTVFKQIIALNALVVQVPIGTEDEYIQRAAQIPGYEYAERNGIGEVVYTPNDPSWGLMWNMRKVKADTAWEYYTGAADIAVGIIDTGIDYDHPDLAAHYKAGGYDWVNNDADPVDDFGHGTHCAGIVAAQIDNSIGVAGVAQCGLWAEKAVDSTGHGTNDNLASAITHATDNGVNIISMSLGNYPYSNLVESACTYAWNHGVLLVAAAGNDHKNIDSSPSYPASYSTVRAVSATNSTDQFDSSYSNYGNKIELSAPGTNVYSTMPTYHVTMNDPPYSLGQNYDYMTGTSMACPHVAGLAALLWSYKPTLTNAQLRSNLQTDVDDLGTAGKDIYYGYGRINCQKAITWPKTQNPTTLAAWGTVPAKMAIFSVSPLLSAETPYPYNYYMFVQLQDVSGNPAYAPDTGVGISLKSSNTTVGTVPSTAIISSGQNSISVYFTATSNPGTSVITAASSVYGSATLTISTVSPSTSPAKLAVYLAPPKQPADSTANYGIMIQLQDVNGIPAKAPQTGVTVALSSSNTTVGTTYSTVTISSGMTYAQTYFYTTYSPGSTQITAVAVGYTSGSATLTTVAPIPTKLAVYMAPSSVPADNKAYPNVFVELQDAQGNPARAPANVQVTFSSSNPFVGTVTSPLTIGTGSFYSMTYFQTTFTPGTTVIKATSSYFAAGSAPIKAVAPKPAKIVLYSTLTLPIGYGSHYTLMIQLQDSLGTPAKSPSGGTPVILTSSNTTVGAVSSPVTISSGQTYAPVSFTTTNNPGSTIIAAVSAGYGTSYATVKTVNATGVPSKLAVYAVPLKLAAENDQYPYAIEVQLQDSSGNPSLAPTEGVGVSLTTTSPSIGTTPSTIVISGGYTYSTSTFYTTYTPGMTTIIAAASGYTSGTASVTTIGRIPTQLAMYTGLPKVLADGSSYYCAVVQLQDKDGNPARAPLGDVALSLWSSNSSVGTVSSSPLSAGSTFVTSYFYSTHTQGSINIGASVFMLSSSLSLSVDPQYVSVGGALTISGQLWPQISTQISLYYRSGTQWTFAAIITTSSTGAFSLAVKIPSMPTGTYSLAAVWMGSDTYRGAVSEIRSFTIS
jgi:thermitase